MDYLDKSEIGSTRNPERSSHKIFIKCKSSSIENEIHTYSVFEQKNRNRHRPLNQFGPKLQQKNYKKIEHIWHGPSN